MPARGQSLRYIRKEGQAPHKKRELIIQRALAGEMNKLRIDFYNDWASGAYLTETQNTVRRSLSSRRGWVDTFIAEPHRGYYGAFIELKREGVRPYKRDGSISADAQIRLEYEFLLRQREKGYYAEFASGFQEAWDLVRWYLELPVDQSLF